MSVSSVPTVSSVSLGTTEALIDEVFLFGRVLRDALVSEGDGHIPRALTGVLLVLAARNAGRTNSPPSCV
ncbi:hypothetical protein HJ581_0029655 [Rhodococcus opacus]|nr:hypothetical protein HJ581_0029655 [Rhodococcus opacus]